MGFFSIGLEELFYFMVSMGASIIGSLCGLGGGIIIKPLLDLIGAMRVDTVSFLSACTVLTMSVVSVGLSLSRKKADGAPRVDLNVGTPLAVGAILGGMLGQAAFQAMKRAVTDVALVGAAQSGALLFTTLAALAYTLFSDRLTKKRLRKLAPIIGAGALLGVVSSFIGIGGGPVNIMLLSYFFSMKTKEAAANSLYIVMFSQGASLMHALFKGAVPSFGAGTLLLMMAGGVAGALVGGRINRTISPARVRALYVALMAAIVLMSCWNFYSFVS